MEAAGIFIGIVVLLGLFFVVWASKNFKRDDSSMEEVLNSEMPYKLEPTETSESGKYPPLEKLPKAKDEDNYRNETTYDVAFPEDELIHLPDHFELYPKPKRKYTKRSTYWTARRKKAAAKKAAAKKAKRKAKPK